MLISHFVEGVRADLEGLGRLGGSDGEEFARRLGEALGPALRARLIEMIDGLVAEVNFDAEQRAFGLGLAGDELSLERLAAGVTVESELGDVPGEFTARVALRLPEELKHLIERDAQRVGTSTNSWIVRALARETAERVSRGARAGARQLRGTGRS